MNEWVYRNKGNLCAGLAVISVLLGTASLMGWFENVGSKIIFVIFCLILLAAITLFLTRRKNVDIEGSRFMSETVTDSLLAIAVMPRARYPVCIQLAVTHAAGSSVGGLASRTMSGHMSFLEDQVNTCCGEVLIERDFTLAKLQEHLDILMSLNSIVFCLT